MVTSKWSLFADRFEVRKPAADMTKLDAILDFFAFISISIGYIVQVSRGATQVPFSRTEISDESC